MKSFAPVAGAFVAPLMIVANNNVAGHATRRNWWRCSRPIPARYSYATSGVGTVHHLGFEMLKAQHRRFIVHIPYRGASQIVPGRDQRPGADRRGERRRRPGAGQAPASCKAIGLMSTGKLPGAENVPAMADALPGFDVAPRLMLLAPAGTPAPVMEQAERGRAHGAGQPRPGAGRGAAGRHPGLPGAGRWPGAGAGSRRNGPRIIKAQKIAVQ